VATGAQLARSGGRIFSFLAWTRAAVGVERRVPDGRCLRKIVRIVVMPGAALELGNGEGSQAV